MKHDINRWIFYIPLEDVQSPEYSKNIQKYKKSRGENEPCLLCGKPINPNRKRKYFVHLTLSGLVSTEMEFEDGEDLGFFPIGSECIKKLPNNFYWRED